MTDEYDVTQVLVPQQTEEIVHVSAQPDLPADEVGPFAETGQRRRVDLVAGFRSRFAVLRQHQPPCHAPCTST